VRTSRRWQAAEQIGAGRAATNDPALIKTVMTFSEPDPIFSVPNPDCPTAADCTAHPAALTRPVFFISTYGFSDSIIASPATEKAFSLSTSVHAALGIILSSDGKPTDRTPIENPHRQPGQFVRLRHGLAGILVARQPDCGRRLHRAASGAGLEH
jgi:hypothetical protein